jgi:hypothetical protein
MLNYIKTFLSNKKIKKKKIFWPLIVDYWMKTYTVSLAWMEQLWGSNSVESLFVKFFLAAALAVRKPAGPLKF